MTHAQTLGQDTIFGVDHVALGSDFDGATIPTALGGVEGMPLVLDALSKAGVHVVQSPADMGAKMREVLGM